MLKFQGMIIPELMDTLTCSKNFFNWVKEQVANDALLQDTVKLMFEEVEMQRQLLLKAERKIRKLMSSEKYADTTNVDYILLCGLQHLSFN